MQLSCVFLSIYLLLRISTILKSFLSREKTLAIKHGGKSKQKSQCSGTEKHTRGRENTASCCLETLVHVSLGALEPQEISDVGDFTPLQVESLRPGKAKDVCESKQPTGETRVRAQSQGPTGQPNLFS